MKKIWNKFYQCDCGTEGIMISYEYIDKKDSCFIDIAFFQHGFTRNKLSLKDKLRYCWNVIRTGLPFCDQVMLNKKIARELGNSLLKWANKK